VSSRYLAAAGAWVLGAAIATTGSIIAVNELAHGLLSQPAQQLMGTETRESQAATAPSSSPPLSVTPTPTSGPATDPPATPVVSVAPQPPPGTFLSSPDGSVVASCQPAGAYLQYWSPDQGFQADDVVRGPAAVAKVTFEGSAGGVIMRVSCTSGTPAAQLEQLPAGGGDGSRSPDE
jgi:hypothetical protein